MESDFTGLLFVMLIPLLLGGMVGYVIAKTNGIDLTQETADQVCFNLTNKSGVVAKYNVDGKLVCETPSFDSTTNIIIITKAGDDRE